MKRIPERVASSLVALHEMPNRMAEYSLFQEALIRRQAQVVQGSASKVDALFASFFSMLSFLTFVAFLLLSLKAGENHLPLELADLLGAQLYAQIERIPISSGMSWFGLLAAVSALFLFLRSQCGRFLQGAQGAASKLSIRL